MKSPSLWMLAALAFAGVVSVAGSVVGAAWAGDALAGPGCPDMPGVCPGDGGYYTSPGPGHDAGNILA